MWRRYALYLDYPSLHHLPCGRTIVTLLVQNGVEMPDFLYITGIFWKKPAREEGIRWLESNMALIRQHAHGRIMNMGITTHFLRMATKAGPERRSYTGLVWRNTPAARTPEQGNQKFVKSNLSRSLQNLMCLLYVYIVNCSDRAHGDGVWTVGQWGWVAMNNAFHQLRPACLRRCPCRALHAANAPGGPARWWIDDGRR